jgi:hypothetical protein
VRHMNVISRDGFAIKGTSVAPNAVRALSLKADDCDPILMLTNELLRLEQAISRLSYEEQLWLIERVIHNLRVSPPDVQPVLNGQSPPKSEPIVKPAAIQIVEPTPTVEPTPNDKTSPSQPTTTLGFEGRPTIKELDSKLQAQLQAIDDAIAELDGLE